MFVKQWSELPWFGYFVYKSFTLGVRDRLNDAMPPNWMTTGVYPAAVTPHRMDGHEADYGAMLELVDFLSRFGTQGVFLLGETGEFLNIRFSDRIRLVHLAVKRSRVPVIAGVSHSTLDGAMELASEAISSDAGALLLMPPYFFRYSQEDVLEFYEQFALQVRRNIPILLDNLPRFTTPIEIETARRLLASGRFAGIRDSSNDPAYFEQLAALQAELGFLLYSGLDRDYAQMRARGVSGIMSPAAGVVPEVYVALDRAISEGAIQKAELLECKIRELADWMDRFPAPVAAKTAVALRKLKTGPPAVPLSPEKDAMLVEFQKWFTPWMEALKNVT
jgi:N-acetylneuraminate lyase